MNQKWKAGFKEGKYSSIAFSVLLSLLAIVVLLPAGVLAGEVSLAWDPPSTEYEGFILSYGTNSGSYNAHQDVGSQTTYTVTNLNPGQTYFFAVKAYNTAQNQESPYSNQVSATLPEIDTTPPAPPQEVHIITN